MAYRGTGRRTEDRGDKEAQMTEMRKRRALRASLLGSKSNFVGFDH